MARHLMTEAADIAHDFSAPAMSGDRTLRRVIRVLDKIRSEEYRHRRIDETTLLTDAGFTSVDMVKVMLEIEAEFDLTIPQGDITPENFMSPATIAAMLGRLAA